MLSNEADSQSLSLFVIPPHYLFAVEHTVAVMEKNGRSWVVAVLAHQESAMARSIAVYKLFIPDCFGYSKPKQNAPSTLDDLDIKENIFCVDRDRGRRKNCKLISSSLGIFKS